MKKSKILGIVLVITLIVLAAGMVSGCTAKPAKVFELTLSTTGPLEESDKYNVVAAAWGKWLYHESDGRIKLTIIPNNQAAKVSDHYEATVKGIVDMGQQMLAFMPGRFPLNEVGQLSGNFDTWSCRRSSLSLTALYNKYPELRAEFKDAKPIWFQYNTSYSYFTTKKPVRSTADLKGLMQIELGPMNSAILQYFGGSPQMVAMEESYDAMAKGVVDGHTISYTAVDQFYPDLLNYCMEAGLQDTPWVVAMNLNTWNKLPSDLQKLFEGENALRVARVQGHMWDEAAQVNKRNVVNRWKAKGLPEPVVLSDADKAKFVEAVKPIQADWVKTAAKIVGEDKARAIMADWFAFGQQYKYTGVDQEAQKIFNEWNALPGY